ncbi:MAG TPA: type II toxin-antitoxin system ParD family antitoxin [Rhizobium sp.]|nr:type II toxin-antitoxin system ParD family antitoxin [Rhizobium sp.]
MQPSRISLNEKQHALIERLIRSGRFTGPNDVVTRGLELLAEHEAEADAFISELEREVDAGLASGAPEAMESAEAMLATFRRQR